MTCRLPKLINLDLFTCKFDTKTECVLEESFTLRGKILFWQFVVY